MGERWICAVTSSAIVGSWFERLTTNGNLAPTDRGERMELTDNFTVKATAAQVWDLFFDLPKVALCLPGCEEITEIDGTTYRARMVQKVGPFQVAMDLDLKIDEVVEGERVVVSGGGKDRMGNTMKLNRLVLQLAHRSDTETDVSYSMDFNLFGRIATLGSAMVKRKAEETTAEFSKRIVAELEASAT
jgi:carbon monoxide dehydrogenase subunit G